MKAQDMLTIPRSIWAKVGGRAVTKIKQDADKGFGTNERGKRYKFKGYTDTYKIKKAAGKAAPIGVSTSKQISPPNLFLTGTMLGSISAQKPTNVGVDIVFRDGLKVKGNADMGRNIFGINQQNEKEIVKNLSDYIGKNVKKYARKPINIVIG
tara:strand:- start:5194 stop:5652 length:459 start_codon:yes stop_codon:yes gene_type:complete